jgi:DNA (cytosine-5)-methyltransferase 1
VTLTDFARSTLIPTPTASDAKGPSPNHDGTTAEAVAKLLPTPVVNDMGEGKTIDAWDDWTDRMREQTNNGNGHGKSLSIEMQRLLPTPTTADGDRGPDYARMNREGSGGDDLLTMLARLTSGRTRERSRGTPQS